MKKIWILAAFLVLLFSACRRDADYVPYIGESDQLAYSNYTEQFEFLWKAISTGYVFWDVDTTDWDAAYERFLPKFQEFDRIVESGGTIPTEDLAQVYRQMMGGMKDHHMVVAIRNLHPDPMDAQVLYVRPGSDEVSSRDYYYESASQEQSRMNEFLNQIAWEYTVLTHETCTTYVAELGTTVTYHYCLFELPDGRKIPYLWQTVAAITPVMREGGEGAELIDHWLRAIVETPRSELAGVILDNRANRGGYQDDLDYLVGSFLNQRTEIMKTRYKEGPGRLEYSAWTPYYLFPNPTYHRDLTAENIPYVVLCDINSVSMGEIEPFVIKGVLPTAHIIGERTYGGTGPLQPATSINLHYGGPFGDQSMRGHHYVYTSSFEALINGQVQEGIGIVPDEIILRKDHDGDLLPQLAAAIQYIQNSPHQ